MGNRVQLQFKCSKITFLEQKSNQYVFLKDNAPSQESFMKPLVIFCLLILFSGSLIAQEEETPVSLKQVIDLALKNNLDIAVESYNPEILDTRTKFEGS